MFQCLREAKRIEAEREQAAAIRTAARPRLVRGCAHRIGKIATEDPRHVRKHQPVKVLVGLHVRLEGIRGRVGGNITGVVETQLRTQLPLDGRLRRREDELDVIAAPRLEIQLGAEDRLEALVARVAVADAQHLGDGRREVRARKVDLAHRDQVAAAGEQFLLERGQHARPPLPGGHEGNTAPVVVVQDAPRGQARLVLGRERELVELGRNAVLGGQEVQRQQRRMGAGILRRRGHLLTRQRADDERGPVRAGLLQRIGHAQRPGVIDTHLGPLGRRHLVERGHEAIAHAARRGTRAPGDRQQQRDVPGARARARGGRRRSPAPAARRAGRCAPAARGTALPAPPRWARGSAQTGATPAVPGHARG